MAAVTLFSGWDGQKLCTDGVYFVYGAFSGWDGQKLSTDGVYFVYGAFSGWDGQKLSTDGVYFVYDRSRRFSGTLGMAGTGLAQWQGGIWQDYGNVSRPRRLILWAPGWKWLAPSLGLKGLPVTVTQGRVLTSRVAGILVTSDAVLLS
ncbi:hypothetical protein ACOMHN_007976 [Nucella lapillus]